MANKAARTRTMLALALVLGAAPGCYEGTSAGETEGGDGSSGGASDGGSDDGAVPPGSAAQMLPARVRRLSQQEYAVMLQTLLGEETEVPNLPNDSVVNGYDNKADALRVTSLMAQVLWSSTPELATALASDLATSQACAGDETDCASTLLADVTARAYRRPVGDEELAALLELYTLGREDGSHEDGIALALTFVLQSPDFLYRTEIGDGDGTGQVRLTDLEIAQAISFTCTGGPPDAELRALAAEGQLTDADVRAAQATRLLATPAAMREVGNFASRWLHTYDLDDKVRDPSLFPEWESVRAATMQEVQAFVATAVLGESATFADLMVADWTIADPTMAAYYGDETGRIQRPAGRRAGALALPAFLAAHARSQDPSPVQRGHFVRSRLLCQEIPPPPNDVVVAPPPEDPTLSNRQRWEQKTNDPSCLGCHSQMDPLGFAFENFDAVGTWRDQDAGAPVDASGMLTGTDVDAAFSDLEALAALLADSSTARECFVANWLEYAHGRALTPDEIAGLTQALDASNDADLAITDLIVEVIASDVFIWRGPSEGQ